MKYRYPDISHTPNGLTVERHSVATKDEMAALAPAVVDLTRRCYRRQLEEPNGPLPTGLIDSVYTLGNKQKAAETRIQNIISQFGNYYIVRSPEDPNRLDGMANVFEWYWVDYETGEEIEREYITDILADPPNQGIGSVLLDVVAKTSGHEHCEGHLDGYRGSSVNIWYETLGFENKGGAELIQFGDHTIPTDRYVIRSLRDVIPILEQRRPELANLEVIW